MGQTLNKNIQVAAISSHNGATMSAVSSIRDDIEDISVRVNSDHKKIEQVENDIKVINDDIDAIERDVRDLNIETYCGLKLTQRKQSFFHNNVVKHISYFIILEIIDIILEIIDIFLN